MLPPLHKPSRQPHRSIVASLVRIGVSAQSESQPASRDKPPSRPLVGRLGWVVGYRSPRSIFIWTTTDNLSPATPCSPAAAGSYLAHPCRHPHELHTATPAHRGSPVSYVCRCLTLFVWASRNTHPPNSHHHHHSTALPRARPRLLGNAGYREGPSDRGKAMLRHPIPDTGEQSITVVKRRLELRLVGNLVCAAAAAECCSGGIWPRFYVELSY